MTYSSREGELVSRLLSSFSSQGSTMDKKADIEKKAMYPFTVHAYDYKLGDWVKAILSEVTTSAYVGKVVGILPKANKVVVKWPHRVRQEDPEWLVKLSKEESGITASSHQLLGNKCRMAQNLVRIARGLRGTGISDVAAFLKMKQAFGPRLPISWLKGAVEVAWPKRTASYSNEAETVRSLYRYAEDLDAQLPAQDIQAESEDDEKVIHHDDDCSKESRAFDPSIEMPEEDPLQEIQLSPEQEEIEKVLEELEKELSGIGLDLDGLQLELEEGGDPLV